MKQLWIYILWCWIVGIPSMSGQTVVEPVYEYPYQMLTIEDGLSQGQIRTSFMDSNGFLWVATKEGVDRFDGLEVVNFRSDSTFIEDLVERIEEDKAGNIWFGGRKGAYKYNGNTFEFFPWTSSIYRVPEIVFIKDTIAFISISEHPYCYYVVADSLEKRPHFYQGTSKRIKCYGYDEEAGIVFLKIATGKSPENYILYRYKNNEGRKLAAHQNIMRISHHSPDSLLFCVGDSLFQWHAEKDSLLYLRDYSFYKDFETYHLEDLTLLQDSWNVFLQQKDREIHQILKSTAVTSKLNISNDRFFLSTEKGLIQADVKPLFLNYPESKGANSITWSMLENDEGTIWFASFFAQEIIQLKGNKYEQLNLKKKWNWRFYSGAINTATNDFWFPAQKDILIFKPDGTRKIIETKQATNYLLEKDNKIYGASKKLNVYENEELIAEYGNEEDLDMETLGFLETLAADTTGKLWLGSHLGLATFDGQQFKNYYLKKDLPSGVVSIKKDFRGNLWFGTHRGISFYDYSTDLPKQLGEGKFNQFIKFIEFIDSSYVLFGGSGKLFLLDLEAFYQGDFEIYTLDKEAGYSGAEILQNSSFKDSKGHIWFGTLDGVVKLLPERLQFFRQPTIPHFSYISYTVAEENRDTLFRIPFKNQHLTFAASSVDRNFEFRFFTINHDNPKKITYRHRLKGFEEDWSLPRTSRFASYNNLPVGKYEFELQTCLGSQCSEIKSIQFEILPAKFLEYKMVQFGIGGLILLSLMAFILNRKQKRQAIQKAEQLENEKTNLELYQIKLRQKMLLNQANPHFIFNLLGAVSNMILTQKTDAAVKYIAKFSNLFRPLLFDNDAMTKKLWEELEFVEDYLALEKVRFPKKVNYEIKVAKNVNSDIQVPKMIIQTFANNAVKHGLERLQTGGKIEITVNQKEDFLHIFIRDNGIGLEVAKSENNTANSGKGLEIIQDMFAYLNQKYPEKSKFEINSIAHTNNEWNTEVTLILFTKYELEKL